MPLDPLLHANPIIQIHVYAAIFAMGLGAYVLFWRKGNARHKMLGRIWVGLMIVVCLTSLFIWELRVFGLFSPIHILSLGTLGALWRAIGYARRRQINAHRRAMQLTYLGALIITGFFTLLPGRLMNRVLFGPQGANALSIALLLGIVRAIALVAKFIKQRRRAWLGITN